MKKISLFILSLVFMCMSRTDAIAQECGSDELHEQLMRTSPEYMAEIEALDRFIYQMLYQPDQLQDNPLMRVDKCEQGRIYTIPVVVHVIHLGEAVGSGSNISDQRIKDALKSAADRFLNASPQSVPVEVRFELAKRSPTGEPTSGINRVDGRSVTNYQTGGISWTLGDDGADAIAIKNLSRWPRDKYYNIWVCHDIAGNIAGYANYPTTWTYEGTVMDYRYMSTSSVTLAHELGHAFNLAHTFDGDNDGAACPPNADCATQGDRVCDTPPHKRSECSASSTCENTAGDPYTNVSRNVMSYCGTRNIFTQGQKDRVKAALFAPTRFSLVESDGLIPVNPQLDLAIIEVVADLGADCSETAPSVRVVNLGSTPVDSFQIRIKPDDQSGSFFNIYQTLQPGEEALISLTEANLPPGLYRLLTEVTKVNDKTLDDYSNNDFVCGEFLIAGFSDQKYCHSFENMALPEGSFTSQNGAPNVEIVSQSICSSNGDYVLAFRPWSTNSGANLTEQLILPTFYLESPDGAALIFDRAHGLSSSVAGLTLNVSGSSDCGVTNSLLYSKTGTSLSTTSRNSGSNPFEPTGCNEWRTDTIQLDAFSEKDATIKFEFQRLNSTSGQNIYLDNFCVKYKYLISAIPSDSAAGSTTGTGVYYEGDAVNLTASPTSGYTFEGWLDGDSLVSSSPNLSLAVEGRRSLVAQFKSINTGIRNLTNSLEATLLPNPARTGTMLVLKSEKSQDIDISIMDISGRLVFEERIFHSGGLMNHSLDVSAFSAGMYFIRLSAGNDITGLKLMVD
jgi:Pregnancy-associated plasma protein-A/Divergent InlB B-repeat domain/Secretion system C-terminal sorting domain